MTSLMIVTMGKIWTTLTLKNSTRLAKAGRLEEMGAHWQVRMCFSQPLGLALAVVPSLYPSLFLSAIAVCRILHSIRVAVTLLLYSHFF
jgi:hypothetical protein